MRRVLLALVIVAALWSPADRTLAAGEEYYQDHPAPESVEEIENPLQEGFEEEVRRPLSDAVRRFLTKLPYVREDAALELSLRSYYLYGKLRSNRRREAWAYGGSLKYDTGWIGERVALGVGIDASQPIHAPSDRDGTLLLRPGQRQYAVFGQSYLKLRLGEHQLALYRQRMNLPYLNRQDNRMTPNSFESYLLSGSFGTSGRLRYVAGYVSRIK